ncbi:MAG TPA: FlgD immunoglobulin-like domain containing protein [Candidatus Kapabacteria bacterium]|jgi:photosystem II stability/assembly factor-like uncharacterized protein
MNSRYRLLIVLFTLFATVFSCRFTQAQTQSEENETLKKPVALPPSVGLYQGLDSIPEMIRQSAPFARTLNEMVRRAGTSGTWDEEARVQAFEQSREDLARSAAPAEKGANGGNGIQPLSNAWTNIGLTSGTNVYGGGCTTAIAIDPTNTTTMYVGGTSGGVWKSTNSGANWVSLTDTWIPNQSVASIAIDPKNHNTIYVGTGNGYASIDELVGTGLWKSSDGGGSWARIGSPTLSGTIVKVMVDPVNSNVIFACPYTSNRGVYRSTDSGSTWTKVYTAGQPVWDMVAGTKVGNVPILYFVEGNNIGSTASECGVYKSGNDGATWSKIIGNLPAGDSIGRSSLAASVAHPERVFVLITDTIGNIIGTHRALFRTTDNGVSWNAVTIPATVFEPTLQQAPQGWYDCTLAVSPSSASGADTMFIAGIEAFYTYNSGTTWVDYSDNNWGWQGSHVDHHSFAFNPKNSAIVYDGCDGGLYWSQNKGFANPNNFTTSWSYRSNQMTTNRFYHLGLDPSDTKTTLAGAQDQGTWKLVTGTGSVQIGGGDGLQPLSYTPASVYYYELPAGDIYDQNNNFLSGQFTDNGYWDSPFKMAMEPINGVQPYRILYTGREMLWTTTDGGSSWNAISPRFNDYIHSIGLVKANPNYLYVGTTSEISFTTDAGNNWTSKSSGMSGIVTSIVTTNKNLNFALASFYTSNGHRVMKTTNGGTNWVDVSGASGFALPNVGVNCVALDSTDPLHIWYAGTDNGIYYTLDSGARWSVAGAGIGLVACTDVEVQANKSTIRVATFGRGIWEASTGTLPVELASFTYQKQTSGSAIGTDLNWITDSEDGTAYFEIDRSLNGASFEPISQVATKAPGGNSTVQLQYSFFDSLHTAGEYLYQLKEVDLDGSAHYSNTVELNWGVNGLIVSQNYPNPFVIGTPSVAISSSFNQLVQSNTGPTLSPWPVTRFHYELPAADAVTLKIYNSTGALVRTLLDNVTEQPGDPDAFWDGRDDRGAVVAGGTYFYVIESGHYGTVVNKMIVISN